MKKEFMTIAILLLAVSSVIATDTSLTPDVVKMSVEDSLVVKNCIEQEGQPLDVVVKIGRMCKDLDGFVGCSLNDELYPIGFNVYPLQARTGEDGCVDVNIETSLDNDDQGVYYYTVNDELQETIIGTETGKVVVEIPEMGIVGSLVALSGVGLYIKKKRKN